MYFLDLMITTTGILSAIGMLTTAPTALIWKISKSRDEKFKRAVMGCLAVTFTLVFLLFMLNMTLEALVRNEVKSIIQSISLNSYIEVNGKSVSPEGILVELRKIKSIPAHNTQPTERFIVHVEDINVDFEIWLERDSSRRNEFWVFYPKYRNTRLNSFARLQTNYFDSTISK